MAFFKNIIDKINQSLQEPKPVVYQQLPYSKTEAIKDMINQQDYTAFFESYNNTSEQQRYLFVASLDSVTNPPFFNNMVELYPDNYLAYFFQGYYAASQAVKIRGSQRADDVSEREWQKVYAIADTAFNLLTRSLEMNDGDSEILLHLSRVMTLLSVDREVSWSYFSHALTITKSHFVLYSAILNFLTKKWGGSYDEMLEFARNNAKTTGDSSSLHGLVALAHIERWLGFYFDEDEEGQECYFDDVKVLQEIKEHYKSFKLTSNCDEFHLTSANNFALVFYISDEKELLKDALKYIGKSFVFKPWCYLDANANEAVDKALKHVNLPILEPKFG